jgi:UDP-glucose 4-epimerase
MTILITGGAGFIGGHTVLAFIDRGEIPIVLDDLSTGNRAAVPDTDTPTVVQTNPSKIRNLRRKVDSLKVVAARDSPELPSKAARVSGLF